MLGVSRTTAVIAGAAFAAAAAAAVAAVARFLDVVAVSGRSMAPALLPGDWLIVESLTYRRRPPRAREVVVARDPRHPSRELVKRAFPTSGGRYVLLGDAPSASTDSRTIGELPAAAIRSRVAFRYWPLHRLGVVR